MSSQHLTTPMRLRVSGLFLLPLAVMLALGFAFPVAAQTPEPAAQEEGPLVRLNLPELLVPVGEELLVEVVVEDVEHLAAFDFTIEFEADKVRFVRAEEAATFLESGERQNVICEDPAIGENSVLVSCVALGPPVCAGGSVGVSGNGLLGRLVFDADAPSVNELKLTESHLILDDVTPCEDAEELVDEIPHGTEDAVAFFTQPSSPVQESPALLRLDAPVEKIEVGDEFEVQVLVEDVEHLGAFDFAISYNPDLLSFKAIRDAGAMLTADEQRDLVCVDPIEQEKKVLISCVARTLPACIGGEVGSSGSGLLGRIIFKAESSGTAPLALTDPTDLVLDDVQPCDPAEGLAVVIPHEREDASVEIAGSDSFPWVTVGVIAGVAAVVVVGGGVVGLALSRRSRAQTSE